MKLTIVPVIAFPITAVAAPDLAVAAFSRPSRFVTHPRPANRSPDYVLRQIDGADRI
jgi:hypothetical protein